MRLNLFKNWQKDESGLVLVFTALVLPLILLVGVLVLQSGQLYVRQAQLQFVARQAANSSLALMAERLKTAAEQNYQASCNVEFPPGVCSSNKWTDFLSISQSRHLASSTANVTAVNQEVRNFATTTDPKNKIEEGFISTVFPFDSGNSSELVVQVLITEPQTNWIGNVLQPESYEVSVEARSYLNLNES